MNIKIYIGCDSSSELAQKVCEYSIQSRQTTAQIEFIKKENLVSQGLLTRTDDLPETTFLKYFVPYLNGYSGWALYCDSSVLFTINVEELIVQAQEQYAIMVTNNDHKNSRSSVILWNCGHESNKKLVPDVINQYSVKELRSFFWLKQSVIGPFSHEYNWSVDLYKTPEHGIPKIINFHGTGPWDPNNFYCMYGAYWEREHNNYRKSLISDPPPGPFDHIPPDLKNLFNDILLYRVDSAGEVFDINKEKILQGFNMVATNNAVAVDGARDPNDGKGLSYDPFLHSFILGCGGQLTTYNKVAEDMTPVVFRGITKAKHMRACEAKGRDYYYIDTGYFGNVRKKLYHRITKNAMQNIGPVIQRPFDRLEATGWRRKKFRPGRDILLCPPSEKAMQAFGLNLDQWMQETIATIKQHTDRPIVIRKKGSRRERTSTDTMEIALSKDVHCLVTFNSIAATEALLLGKPAFTLGPNAAHTLCHKDLALIESPYIPSAEELEAWAAHLAYCQFTEAEMRDGTAWQILNENSNLPSSSTEE